MFQPSFNPLASVSRFGQRYDFVGPIRDIIIKKATPFKQICLIEGGGFLKKGGFLNNNTPDAKMSGLV